MKAGLEKASTLYVMALLLNTLHIESKPVHVQDQVVRCTQPDNATTAIVQGDQQNHCHKLEGPNNPLIQHNSYACSLDFQRTL